MTADGTLADNGGHHARGQACDSPGSLAGNWLRDEEAAGSIPATRPNNRMSAPWSVCRRVGLDRLLLGTVPWPQGGVRWWCEAREWLTRKRNPGRARGSTPAERSGAGVGFDRAFDRALAGQAAVRWPRLATAGVARFRAVIPVRVAETISRAAVLMAPARGRPGCGGWLRTVRMSAWGRRGRRPVPRRVCRRQRWPGWCRRRTAARTRRRPRPA